MVFRVICGRLMKTLHRRPSAVLAYERLML